MTIQNYSKLLALLKDYANKAGYDKNLQINFFKDWLDILQRMTYTPINALKKQLSVEGGNIENHGDVKSIEKCKDNANKSQKISTEEDMPSNRSVKCRKTCQQMDNDTKNVQKVEVKEQSYTLLQIFDNLKFKLASQTRPGTLIIPPKWKVNVHNSISKHSIVSRTRHVLNSIVTAESNASTWRRIEDLLTHIDQYPEARHYAIKEGAIRTLLKTRRKTRDDRIKASIREALTVLGYVDPLPGRGIRILSIDGGGMRGVLVIEMLKKLEELTGKKTHEMFDYICGVSTGAILAATLGGHRRKSLSEISELYKELSIKVFTQSTIKGTSNLVWSHAYYDTALWEKLLQEHLGDKILIKTARDPNTPKFSAISAIVNHERVMAYVFRNYTLPHRVESQYIGSHKHKLWEAIRASAAAPSYFEEFKYGEFLHQDGGILVNNPCAVALHEAKQLWPNNPIQCVISFGTGRTPNRMCESNNESMEIAISSWKEKFYKILDSATDTEAVHTMLNDLLPEHVYYRFNPYLTEMISMVEIRPEKITQMEQDAKMYIRRNEEKFQKAAEALLQKRQIQQKIMDWIVLQKQTSGL
ncbi:calcium-independent phospholipase A2-gamma [Nomia melanderi]|uniref:calcium-independent phospholipase A2-gamma n=1 Tax=Nomia melanderi TaxID=2448451 RepID=UPI001304423B|nr:calcium-independent phospholipase A2-gamma-like isoform X1 [Nomia melanderi]XP_031832306.1 calcium-independent phospholipase A2-gamma-like isoform X1 [Nomia melanderi]XP_031832307.1 calcium-independent phospholipase A2-gamma-like isoform X1 [Nomia melanderi]XP_031832308.1 calcium-independent phospholipase A2-gamma-like isoform X1 [Nomia melanderi]